MLIDREKRTQWRGHRGTLARQPIETWVDSSYIKRIFSSQLWIEGFPGKEAGQASLSSKPLGERVIPFKKQSPRTVTFYVTQGVSLTFGLRWTKVLFTM